MNERLHQLRELVEMLHEADVDWANEIHTKLDGMLGMATASLFAVLGDNQLLPANWHARLYGPPTLQEDG